MTDRAKDQHEPVREHARQVSHSLMEIDSYDNMGGESNGTGSSTLDGYLTPVEHITRIQLRNFTPFPARDAFASALTQPSEQSQFTSYGSLSDDLDVALARKRTRKLSSASLATVRKQKVRKRTVSRVSARELPTTASSGSYPPLSGTGLVTKATRPRAHSIASSISAKGAVSTATLWQSYTQKTLEKVLQSRLVETFITVTVPSSLINSNASPASKRGLHSPRDSPSRSPSSSREERLAKRVSRTGTATPTDNPTSPSSNRRVAASPTKHASKAAEPASRVDPETWTVPNFISAIHRPSTNPDFALDLNDFSKWSDPLATRITVQLWAKLRPDTTGIVGGDKGKEKMSDGMATVHPQWKMAGSWDICLSDLVPLPDENSTQTSSLPSNTLLVTLSPPGKVFHLPVAPSSGPTRSPSPSSGYNSDPEVHTSGNLSALKSATPRRKDFSVPRKTRQSRAENAATSSWQDLVKLVNLQCAIIDTRQSLSKVIQNVDALFGPSGVNRLQAKEVSEREATLAHWRTIEARVRVECKGLSERIRQRKEELRHRREMLSLATSMLDQDVSAELITEQELSSERDLVAALRQRISPIRATLIATLAYLFPIDLISASDLLFSILGAPLPIPLGATDPAPPLSLPAYKDVNDECIATSLAYAALVVQLLAVYLDRMLVYPITFCGSRSMIRDGISAMVGPRMFPLFSKGVDTYRFEYGVFLLNKNIEMLMSDRDLRALDMRHTLPNLKNLLLTLSDGEGSRSRILRSPATSLTGLESPIRPSSPEERSSSTGSASTNPSDAGTESPGSTTPSKASLDSHHGSLSRMSRPFFGLSGFLRSRYPSSTQRPSVKAVPEALEGGTESEGGMAEEQGAPSAEDHNSDDEDRRTLRGVP
ncbi:hypothetical protein BGW80DRAFT_1453104 [Lactifluus volemus]|nr:hypothetical protein BGW80DRAFT_1453104 [Lactifluus volemus]